jgi:heterodisulfide reductase subunit C
MKIDPKTFIKDYQLDICIQCGTCTGGCPVKFRSPLNMRRLVRETFLTDLNYGPVPPAALVAFAVLLE